MNIYIVAGLGVFSALLVILGLRGQKSAAPEYEDRLNTFASRAGGANQGEEQEGFFSRILKPAVKRWSTSLGQRSPGAVLDKTRLKLQQAGSPSGMGPVEFIGLRYLLTFGIGGGAFLLLFVSGTTIALAFMFAAVAGIFGFIMPNIWLDRKVKGRRKEITRSLPDAIDLLTISVESGLGFDPALQRVAEKWDNHLTREFARVLSEMRIGKSKREAS